MQSLGKYVEEPSRKAEGRVTVKRTKCFGNSLYVCISLGSTVDHDRGICGG